jgi:hypothetical protein
MLFSVKVPGLGPFRYPADAEGFHAPGGEPFLSSTFLCVAENGEAAAAQFLAALGLSVRVLAALGSPAVVRAITPRPPKSVGASVSGNVAALSWESVPHATGYVVTCGEPGCARTSFATVDTPGHTATLEFSKRYSFAVRSVNAAGQSAESPEAPVKTAKKPEHIGSLVGEPGPGTPEKKRRK